MEKEPISSIRKDFYKRLVFIGLCAVVLWVLADETGPLRWVAFLAFFLGALQFIAIILHSPMIVNDFFPPKVKKEAKVSNLDSYINYSVNAFWILGLVLLIFNINDLDNTLDGSGLFWRAAGIGIGIGVLVTIVFKYISSTLYQEGMRRYTIHFGVFVGWFLFMPSMGNIYNRWQVGAGAEICTYYEISRKGTGGKADNTYWLFLKTEQDEAERFEVERSLYHEMKEGEEVQLCAIKGKLGYEYVTRIGE